MIISDHHHNFLQQSIIFHLSTIKSNDIVEMNMLDQGIIYTTGFLTTVTGSDLTMVRLKYLVAPYEFDFLFIFFIFLFCISLHYI